MNWKRATAVLFGTAGLLGLAVNASATHYWSNYHWARTANPFYLMLGDNVSGAWDSVLDTTIIDWNQSAVIKVTKVAGLSNPKNCKPTLGRVEVCNSKYGANGWLGIAQIWINSSSHITQGTTKLNDTYFSTPTYGTTEWRNLVSCQEVGHTFGMAHQDENFTNPNLGTCMDYTNDPLTNQHPNQHDYDLLVSIYSHLDSTTTVASGSVTSGSQKNEDGPVKDGPNAWGKLKKAVGNHEEYELDLGNGTKVVTHVIWVPGETDLDGHTH